MYTFIRNECRNIQKSSKTQNVKSNVYVHYINANRGEILKQIVNLCLQRDFVMRILLATIDISKKLVLPKWLQNL